MLGSSISMGAPNTLTSTNAVDLMDDVHLSIGSDKDSVILNRSSTLNANTTLTGVIEGTPVTPALAANSLIISNQTNDGDILIVASDGGNSKAAIWVDGSTPLTAVYNANFPNAAYVTDDILFGIGTSSDGVLVNRSTTLNADTALTGVIIGTPDTPALAANSFIIANATSDGDILIVGNDGGHSRTALFFDSSVGNVYLGKPGTPGSATASGDVYAAGAVETDGMHYADGGTTYLKAIGTVSDLTISAGGAVAVTGDWHRIIPNGGAGSANDDLSTATGGVACQELTLSPKTTAAGGNDQITVKDGTGADTFILAGGADFVMDHVDDRIRLKHNGTEWVEISRSSNS